MAAVRYTPAGVPVLELLLEHQSDLIEAGIKRTVCFYIKAVALGTNAEALVAKKANFESYLEFSGFLAASRNGKDVVFHIQDFHRM